ncbi:hypothetical protein BLOT_004587 [Blomia tropicalis]|nr:hypothetical protein BLOT_004587 [Blomia tropicalis]
MDEQIQYRSPEEFRSSPTSSTRKEQTVITTLTRLFTNSYVHFILLLTLCAFIGIGLPIISSTIWRRKVSLNIESDLRYECLPLREFPKIRNTSCLNPCIWDNFTILDTEITCYYGMEIESDMKKSSKGSSHFGTLPRYSVASKVTDNENINDEPFECTLELENAPPFLDKLNVDLHEKPVLHQFLSFHVRHYDNDHLSILIKPHDEDEHLWSRNFDFNYEKVSTNITSNGRVRVTTTLDTNRNDIFQLQVNRKSSNTPLFNMGTHTPFIFAKGYMEISTMLVNDVSQAYPYIYGLGQSNFENFQLNFSYPKSWTLLNQYTNELLDTTKTMWGSHPFYLGIDDPTTGNAHGVLLVNSHPIQVSTNSKPSLTFKTFGGHLEFHIFLGPKPKDVIRQLQEFVHFPAMPPYWALGFHACVSTCAIPSPTMTDRLNSSGIPVESDCGTALRRQYSHESDERNEFANFKRKLEDFNGRFLSIEPPHHYFSSHLSDWNNFALRKGSETYLGQFQRCDSGNNLETNVNVLYPDVFNPKIKSQYQKEPNFFKTLADGYFLDFNTPINLENVIGSTVCTEWLKKYKWNAWNFGQMNELNPCMDLLFSANSFNSHFTPNESLAYELGPYMAMHNLYGFAHSKLIHTIARESKNERPLVMSLSTFVGSGRYGGHIGSPINSNWTSLRLTLKQSLDFSIFGIPLNGYPVGGYRGEKPNDELLRRWFQLASVQPFMIGYTDYGHEPRMLIKSSLESIRSNIQTRYKLLPYFYTLFYNASTYGTLVLQPMFMEFYDDDETFKIANQFMIGDSLLASPVLKEDETMVKAYFPRGRWYEYYSGHLASKSDGGYQDISAVEQNINLHLRGGHIIPTHNKNYQSIRETRKYNGFQVIVALDENNQAYGTMYIDDGISQNIKDSLMVHFYAQYNNISVWIDYANDPNTKGNFCRQQQLATSDEVNTMIENIKIYGIIQKPLKMAVSIDWNQRSEGEQTHNEVNEPAVKYQNNFGVLSIDCNIDLCKSDHYLLSWSYTDY